MNFGKRTKGIVIIFIVGIFYLIFTFYRVGQNEKIVITDYNIESSKITKNYRIIHLSDLHGVEAGWSRTQLFELGVEKIPYKYSEKRIIDEIKKFEPNLIVVTGDSFKQIRQDHQVVQKFYEEIKQIAPVYIVLGDTDYKLQFLEGALTSLEQAGIKILQGESIKFEELEIMGLDEIKYNETEVDNQLKLFEKNNNYKILLSHYSEKFDEYSKYNLDLVLSGNTLGGKYRLPFIKNTKYHYGLYNVNGTELIVSSGLGNPKVSTFFIPQRINSPKEIGRINLLAK